MGVCPLCGPKLSICCSIVSIWGIIMLALMGVFYKLRSPALFEDLPMTEENWKEHDYSKSYMEDKYDEAALNCFIATGLYVLCFIFSFVQFRMNSSQSYEMR